MKWFHFILSHSIFIAICSVALAFQAGQLLGFTNNLFVYGFVFFATLCSYNFYWLLSKTALSKGNSLHDLLSKEKPGLLLMIVAAAGVAYCFFQSGLSVTFVLTAAMLTIAYAVPLLPISFLKFTRKAGVLKTFLLAFTWAYVTVLIPIQKTYPLLDNADLFIFTRRFLFMLMLCIIFDNRDKAVDKIRGLHSLATDLKPSVLNIIIYLIFAVLFISNLFYKDFGIAFYHSIGLQVATLALLIVYFFSLKKRGYFFYYFVVDGMMLFSAIATLVAGI